MAQFFADVSISFFLYILSIISKISQSSLSLKEGGSWHSWSGVTLLKTQNVSTLSHLVGTKAWQVQVDNIIMQNNKLDVCDQTFKKRSKAIKRDARGGRGLDKTRSMVGK